MRIWQRQLLSIVFSINIISVGVPANGGAGVPSVGVILLAERAQLSGVAAGAGATVFDGDTLATELNGSLRVRSAAAQLQLLGGSEATLKQTPAGLSATLRAGTLLVSSAKVGAIEVSASDARIRPKGPGAMQAQITFVSPKEVLVTSRRGTLEISVDEQTQLVPEATSYRVLIEPAEGSTAQKQPQRKKGGMGGAIRSAGRSRFMLLALIASGAATIIMVDEALESPAKP